MNRAFLAALVAALLAVPAAAADGLAAWTLTEIVEKIDATSFPNSIEPREEDHLVTFADYGFTRVELVGDTAELYDADGSWMFALTLLVAGDDHLVLCILDRALGGPTYNAQGPVAFELSADGLLVATASPWWRRAAGIRASDGVRGQPPPTSYTGRPSPDWRERLSGSACVEPVPPFGEGDHA